MVEDNQIRLLIFLGVLLLMCSLETVMPKRIRQQSRSQRWQANLGLVIINSVVLKLLGPITAVVAADYALDNGWGLLSRFAMPLYLDIIVGVVVLDLAIYAQHVISHRIPLLWRLHKVHHADRDIDATSGIRFHPVEVVLSMLYKCLVILLLGPVTIAVVLFEIILNASAMFNHANLRLPLWLDRVLRLLIVTPDMHRVHHSVIQRETNSNYGFFLSIWDRVFRTYNAQPEKGHDGMTIGLAQYQSQKPASLLWCMALPFSPEKSDGVADPEDRNVVADEHLK